MGSATARRFALVAVIVLLAPAWCRQVASAGEQPGNVLFRPATQPAGPGPAIRRHASPGSSLVGSRLEQSRALAMAGAPLLLLAALVLWTTLAAVLSAPSSLGRRRHVISLRAPPLVHAV